VIVQTNAAGDFCVHSQEPTDLIVDLAGTLSGAAIGTPVRVFDSRPAPGVGLPAPGQTGCLVHGIGGTNEYIDPCPPGAARTRHIDFTVGTGLPSAIVVLQVTTDHYDTGIGYTAVYQCGTGYQGTSSVNNKAYPVASNLVIATTDAGGNVCVHSQLPTDIIVDVVGTLTNANIVAPTRVLDTRYCGLVIPPAGGDGGPPVCHAPFTWPTVSDYVVHTGISNSIVAAQITTDYYVGGVGYTSVFACADGFRGTSSLNNTGNQLASNLVIVPTDADGDFCVQSEHPTDLIVDLIGTLGGADIQTPTRILDTREE